MSCNEKTLIAMNKLWTNLHNRPLVRDTITTTIWSTIGKGAGFLIPFFIAAWFGITAETDAFFFAYGLIIFLATIFSPVVESIIVPFIAEAKSKGEDVGVFVGRILGISAIGLLVILFIFLVISKLALSALTRFSPEGLNLVYSVLIETSPLVILIVWTSILAGALNAYKVFSIPALSPAFRAVVTLGFIFLFARKIGVHSIAWGYVAGEIFRLLLLFGMLRKLNIFRIKLSIGWESKIAEFFKISSYQIIGMSLLAFTPIINKTMASWLGSGNVSLLEYADRLYIIPITFLSSGLMVALLSHWSERYQEEGDAGLNKDVAKAVKNIGIIGIILTLFLFLTKDILVNLAYGYGQFPKEKLNDIGEILGCFLLGITPYFWALVYVRAFLIKKKTKALFLTVLFMITGTIMFNILFIRIMGIPGIALSNSVMAFLSFGMLSFLYYRGGK